MTGLFIAAAVFTGCNEKKSEYDDNGTKSDVKLLVTETSGYHLRKFMYDDQNRIKEMWTYSGGILHYKTILTYNGEELIKSEDVYFENGEIELSSAPTYFLKKDNTIRFRAVIISEEEEQGSSMKRDMTLNKDGLPEILDETPFGVIDYTYLNGNLTIFSVREKYDRNYTYGTFSSPYSSSNTPKWFMFWYFYEGGSHNSLTKEEVENNSTTYEYVCDSDGFPTKRTAKRNDGTETITEYEYNY